LYAKGADNCKYNFGHLIIRIATSLSHRLNLSL